MQHHAAGEQAACSLFLAPDTLQISSALLSNSASASGGAQFGCRQCRMQTLITQLQTQFLAAALRSERTSEGIWARASTLGLAFQKGGLAAGEPVR